MSLFLITVFVFAFVIFIMALGVIFSDRRISGSCGGEDGCDICFFKCEKKRDKPLSDEKNITPSCEGGQGESGARCSVEVNLSETGK